MPEWCEREEPSGRRRVPRFARHYDPQLGRFYSIDPLPSAASPYEYCGGNPVRYADPSGMTIERLPFIDAEFEYNGNPLTGGGAYGGGYDPFRGYDKCYRNFHGGQGGGAGLNWGSRDVNGATVFYAYHVSRLADASGQSYSTESLAWGMALGTHRFEQAMLRAWMYAEFGRGPAPTLDPGVRMNPFMPTLITPEGMVEIGDLEPQTVMLDYTMPQVYFFPESSLANPLFQPSEEGLISDPTIFLLGFSLYNAARNTAIGVATIGFKAGFHSAHHNFPIIGKQPHYQFNIFLKGVRGSGKPIRIPWPF